MFVFLSGGKKLRNIIDKSWGVKNSDPSREELTGPRVAKCQIFYTEQNP